MNYLPLITYIIVTIFFVAMTFKAAVYDAEDATCIFAEWFGFMLKGFPWFLLFWWQT